MANPSPYYAIQPSFAGGEISKSVASRVDLEKYQSALLLAENAFIKPYGGIYKRGGTIFCGETKFHDKKSMLVKFTFSSDVCYTLEFGDKYIRVWKNGEYLNIEITTPYTDNDLSELRFTQSADVIYICSGKYPVQVLTRFSETEWDFSEIELQSSPYEAINGDETNCLTPSAASGIITITATKNTFKQNHVGGWIKLLQEMQGTTVTCKSGTSESIRVGQTWKIITHGTWTGSVTVQYSLDNTNWKQLRKYTSASDFNATESGTVEEYSYLRLVVEITGGSCTADLASYPYTHESHVQIAEYIDEKTIKAKVIDALGDTSATVDWNMGCWNDEYGYPYCSTFFQDRLIFGGNNKNPYTIWMSKSGDYTNFSVEKASGNVTDDSAISVNLISRNLYKITHLIQGQDLIILTDGNEWIISGNDIVTPTNITPKIQTSRGCNNCEPQYIGNRIIFIQKRGSTIRDMGYSYDSDNYTGVDLSLLAKHLVKDKVITDCTYCQDPDSMVLFTRNDGVILCLTYNREQEVFAWSHIQTDGEFESVLAVNNSNEDVIYAVVKREINGEVKRYIEKFSSMPDSENAQDYVMLDSSKIYTFVEPVNKISGLDHLKGKSLKTIADGYCFEDLLVDENGEVELPASCKNIVIGLPYTMKIQQPNFEAQMRDGSMQGRSKTISEVFLRLENSRGGFIGGDFTEDRMDEIIFEEGIDVGETDLYTGDKKIQLPAGGFNEDGRVCIQHSDPYPFSLSAIIRVVSFGG